MSYFKRKLKNSQNNQDIVKIYLLTILIGYKNQKLKSMNIFLNMVYSINENQKKITKLHAQKFKNKM